MMCEMDVVDMIDENTRVSVELRSAWRNLAMQLTG